MESESMLTYLDRAKPSTRYWMSYAIICSGFVLDFYDFFIVGFLLAVVGPAWHLTYGEASWILLAGGLGAIVGSLFFGALSDKFGRKRVYIASTVLCSLAAGSIALIPDGDWVLFALIRVVVGIGLGGIATIQIVLLGELTPTPYRVKVTGFPLMGPSGGTLLAAFTTAALIATFGWRGVALLGLFPLVLAVLTFIVMPESPRWLVANQRPEAARRGVAALAGAPLNEVPTETGAIVRPPRASLLELLHKPGRFFLVIAVWISIATCNYAVYLWGPTISAILLNITVAQAAKYFVYVSLFGILGRFLFSIIPSYIGRRRSGQLIGVGLIATFGLAAILHDDFYAGMSMFIVMIALNALFNDGCFSTLSPYTAEIFPVRLMARGLGLAQAANGIGKVLGPYILAVIAGTHKLVSRQATEAAIVPTFLFLVGCGVVVLVCHLFFAPETLGCVLALDDEETLEATAAARSGRNLSAAN